MQLQLQTIFNNVHRLKGFVYEDIRLVLCQGAAAHIEGAHTVYESLGSLGSRASSARK